MKLGEVLALERERRQLTPAEAAARLGISTDEYEALERGACEAEKWGPLLAEVAISLGVPTARLLTDSGRPGDARHGEVGSLIRKHREQRGRSVDEMATALELAPEEYATIEAGVTPLERWGPLLLAFAEMVGEPVFNLFYPCGIALRSLDADILRRERLTGVESGTSPTEGWAWQSSP